MYSVPFLGRGSPFSIIVCHFLRGWESLLRYSAPFFEEVGVIFSIIVCHFFEEVRVIFSIIECHFLRRWESLFQYSVQFF